MANKVMKLQFAMNRTQLFMNIKNVVNCGIIGTCERRTIHSSKNYYKNTNTPTLTMFTKEICPLCDEAKEELKKYRESERIKFETVDITLEGNEELYEQYKYEIPVFHLNGKDIMRHRVNHSVMERKLKELETNMKVS